MRKIIFVFAMLLSVVFGTSAQEVHEAGSNVAQCEIKQESLTVAQCIDLGEYTIYIMDVAMPGSRAMQVYSDYQLTYSQCILNGKMPLFTRDKSAKEYRDFTFNNVKVEDYKVEEKKGNYTISMLFNKGSIGYELKIVSDTKGIATILLTNQKLKSVIKYTGRLKEMKKKSK